MKKSFKNLIFLAFLMSVVSMICSCGIDNIDQPPALNVSEIILSPEDSVETSSTVSFSESSEDISSTSSSDTSYVTSSNNTSNTSSENTVSIPSSEPYDGDWKLILVNSESPLPSNFEVKTANIGNRPMDERIVDIVKQMIADAKADGIDLLICSSYRSVDRQITLFNEQIQKFKNKGYNDEDARTEAAKWVAIPGTSEHHTGLALDIVTPTYQVLDFGFEETDAFKWLSTHCTEYGFILRYPEDKTDITKIVYEPWHYRYVGVETAKYIHANNLCLEEYIQQQPN